MSRTALSARHLLVGLALFKGIDRATLARLAAATTRIELRRGQRLFSTGDRLTGMYVVVYGEVRLLAPGPRRRRLTRVVAPGASFAEPMMFLERAAVVDAEAASDALVLHVPKQALVDEIEVNPLFARQIIASLCRRIETLVQEAAQHAVAGGRDRLIEYLQRNARPVDDGALVVLPAPKAVIASHLHLTPEHFSRILHELAADRVIRIKARRIEIPDLDRLTAGRSSKPTREFGPRDEPSTSPLAAGVRAR
jgi:CRP/FNR family transcriptional regulator, dissimilatory nitrate respiration regulator